MNSVIFIGGVHGVGKTTVAKVASAQLTIPTHTCSALIREELSADSLDLHGQSVVERNQRALLQAVRKVANKFNSIMLDGHFSLVVGGITPTPVPLEFFLALAPRAVLLIEDDPFAVSQRLMERDGKLVDPDVISERMQYERSCAERVCGVIGLDLLSSPPDPSVFCGKIRGILSRSAV